MDVDGEAETLKPELKMSTNYVNSYAERVED